MDDQQRARELLSSVFNEQARVALLNSAPDAPAVVSVQGALITITAALRAAQEGFVLVPEVMDLDMEVAFCEAWFSKRRCIDDADMQDAWAAALAARPQGVKDAT